MAVLANKVALITGASYGLGKALAIGMAREGADIVLVARNERRLLETADQVSKEGHRATSVPMDIGNWSSVNKLAERVLSDYDRLDILVNNAAGWVTGPIVTQEVAKLQEMISTTMTGTIMVTKAFLQSMISRRSGHIINVTSTAAKPKANPKNSSVTFIAAKAGMAAFSEALRQEIGHYGIRVTTLYPGSFATDTELDDQEEIVLQKYGLGTMPLRELVDTIIFIATRPSSIVEEITISSVTGDR